MSWRIYDTIKKKTIVEFDSNPGLSAGDRISGYEDLPRIIHWVDYNIAESLITYYI